MEQQFDNNSLVAFTRGDAKAFEAVYRLLYTEVLHFVNKLVEDTQEAEDITSETFITLYKDCEKINSYDHIKGFLRTTARYRCLDFIRRRNNRRSQQKSWQLELSGQLTNDQTLEHLLIKEEVIARLYKEIEQLPEECRKIFKMLFYEGIEPKEIASLLNISVSTVRSQKSRALKLLRLALSDNQLALAFLLSFSYLARHLRLSLLLLLMFLKINKTDLDVL